MKNGSPRFVSDSNKIDGERRQTGVRFDGQKGNDRIMFSMQKGRKTVFFPRVFLALLSKSGAPVQRTV